MSYLTVKEVATRWKCSPGHVQRLASSGLLAAMKLGRRGWRIRLEAVEAYERANSSEPAVQQPSPIRAASPQMPPPILGALPDGYEPRFPEAYGLPPRTTGAASSAAGRGKRKASR